MIFRNGKIFLRTLVRYLWNEIFEALSRRSSYLSTFQEIDLTHGVYFLVSAREAEARLMSVGPDFEMSVALSIDEAKRIFRSIERAYDDRELVEIKLADLSWKTDCRVRSNPDKVTVSFKRGWERTRVDARRQDLATAIAMSNRLLPTE